MKFKIGQELVAKKDTYYLPFSDGDSKNIPFIKDNVYNIYKIDNAIHIMDEYGESWYFNIDKESDYYVYDHFISPSEWRELQINSILDGN